MLAPDYQTDRRMALKREAIPLPDLSGKRVLDIGCDQAYWCRLASDLGAIEVVGLDRNRLVRGEMVDLIALNREQKIPRCRFERINIGKEWREFGRFDVVLTLSVYHHIFQNCGDHSPIWFWLRRQIADDGILIWEGPVDDTDPVVRANVSDVFRLGYNLDAILKAAGQYFEAVYIGPALHEPTREVWRFTPKSIHAERIGGELLAGGGGAKKAFEHANGRRMDEIERILGRRPIAGSLNVRLDGPFDWNRAYFRAQVLDVEDRTKGLDSPWAPRWARFYPLTVDGLSTFAFRFENEHYDSCFVELIADRQLRDMVAGPRVEIARC